VQVIADTREQNPWTFEDLGVHVTRATLHTGDYSLPGLEHRVAIERKSADDFVGTVLRERARFYQELERLRAFEFRAVIVEASVRDLVAGRYRSRVRPEVVLGFVGEIAVAQSVPVYLAGSRAEAQVLAAAFLRQAEKKLSSSPGLAVEGVG